MARVSIAPLLALSLAVCLFISCGTGTEAIEETSLTEPVVVATTPDPPQIEEPPEEDTVVVAEEPAEEEPQEEAPAEEAPPEEPPPEEAPPEEVPPEEPPPEETPPEETPPEEPAEEEPVEEEFTVTEEMFTETFENIREIITDLNGIIRDENYDRWLRYLAKEYIDHFSSSNVLRANSDQPLLKKYSIVLHTLQDYFKYVVVPSRSNARLDDLVFIDNDHVKAIMIISERRTILYQLAKVDGVWKIGL